MPNTPAFGQLDQNPLPRGPHVYGDLLADLIRHKAWTSSDLEEWIRSDTVAPILRGWRLKCRNIYRTELADLCFWFGWSGFNQKLIEEHKNQVNRLTGKFSDPNADTIAWNNSGDEEFRDPNCHEGWWDVRTVL